MKSLPLGGCSPMSILIALVIAGIILIMVASVNDATTPTTPSTATPIVVETAVLISPLALPANNVPAGNVVPSGQSAADPCASGCMLDNMCGGTESIIARLDSATNSRYYYTPDHPDYQTFRTAETQGQVNYYFCTTAQAESQGWRRSP